MDTPPLNDRIAAVVALKTLPAAKSRMSLPAPVRERLARCMALDTLAALVPAVDEVLVISDQPDLPGALVRHGLGVRVVPEPVQPGPVQPGPVQPGPVHPGQARDAGYGPGASSLNRALAFGDARLRSEGFSHVLACVGDLPALRTGSVQRVLAAAADRQRSFLADHEERGTTMLIARRTPLNPFFGTTLVAGRPAGSALTHRRSGAVPLTLGDLGDARWDVDTIRDLRVARGFGLGPATTAMVDPVTGSLGRYRLVQVRDRDTQMITVLDDGHPVVVALPAYDGDPAHLVPGRRLHAVRVAGSLRCWA